ncbi:MAG: pyridoxine 5'-phosphate synthase [Kiritimatiellae bacterium]|nr:pyridoxine 5'-phosphate synthase [Kiritimatiellia bacterium]MCO5067327.1 pyridoxine 5'-phosphate synthase [Kiritimatiellia bacterium]
MKLGVNIDHVATLRQARGTVYPDPFDAGRVCAEAGAHGITVHLREDRRHIQDRDVERLIAARPLPINLEMANAAEIVAIALRLRPEEVCLVPERRQELTTEGGLDVVGQEGALRPTVAALRDAGIAVSLFIAPEPRQIEMAAALGAPFIELHTGTFCDASGVAAEEELRRLIEGAQLAHRLGLKVNAGHGINLDNLPGILRIPHLDTLNIGHSIIARSVFVGLREAIAEMLRGMAQAPS